jgi:hypothetical protein
MYLKTRLQFLTATKQWNNLPGNVKNTDSISKFKHALKSIQRDDEESDESNLEHTTYSSKVKARFYAGTRKGQILHNRIRLGNCDLNENLTSISLAESAECPCGHHTEDATHFLLHCPLYTAQRLTLIQETANLNAYLDMMLTNTYLHGENRMPEEDNVTLFCHSQDFIIKSKRFD